MRLIKNCQLANIALFVNKNNKKNFQTYITGLIEGDGTILTPSNLRSPKGKLYYPSIQIVFHQKDLPLASLLKNKLNYGSLHHKKNKNAYIYSINSKEDILNMINILNGNMRTPKIHSLHKLID